MKPVTIYRINYLAEDTPSGVTQEWFTTFNKAEKRLRHLGLRDQEEVQAVDVDRSKVGLVQFLNIRCQVG